MVASAGAAGIPAAGLVTMVLVFKTVGLPPEYIGMLLPIDCFLDRCRTAVNVMRDVTVSCDLDGRTRSGNHQPPGYTHHAPAINTAAEVGSDLESHLE